MHVERAGPLTTVQDLGRLGFAHLGVARAGAVDRLSLRLANRLVGNQDNAAAFECTVSGPQLRFAAEACIAVTGGTVDVVADGQSVQMNRAILVRAGGTVRIGTITRGVRCYVAVSGGIDVPPVLRSRSTDTLSWLGPGVVRPGDDFGIGRLVGRLCAAADSYDIAPQPAELRVVAGPHPAAAVEGEYVVSPVSDRTGVRFTGPVIDAEPHIASMGLVEGAVQVPPDGQPIALLANHQTTGGYAVPFVVIEADLPLLAQARPGTRVRFESVSFDRAAELLALQRRWLDSAVVDL